MAEFVTEDLVEEMLLRFDVNDLIRCKSVCKSWHSLITSRGFITRHLNHSYNKDRYNSEFGHRRITYPEVVNIRHRLVGSINGLVCILTSWSKLLVGNPLTREVRQLAPWIGPCISFSTSYGFGYDSSRDDYKVIIGARTGENQTSVYEFSLRSNVWRLIREVNYWFTSKNGILCNGALHWIVTDENKKKMIISYDLSKEEFKEIPLPVDAGYGYGYILSRILRIINECLCMYLYQGDCVDIWVMRNNVKQSWELLSRDHKKKYDIVYFWDAQPKEERVFHPNESSFSWASESVHWDYAHAPIFVESLVSPYLNVNL